jgi:hypothetical protein
MQQTPIIAIYLGDPIIEEMRRAQRLSEVGNLAASQLASLPVGVEMVFGPITRGGHMVEDPRTGISAPSYRDNIKALERTILALQRDGHFVFNQLLFKPLIDKHRKIWLSKHNRAPSAWHEPLKNEFYAPILDTGKVFVGHFILDWRRGNSAKFAHQVLVKQGKQTFEYRNGYEQKIAA